MSAEMPPDQWGMLTVGAKNRNWNPSNVISKFFGTGAAAVMSESGERAFKRQLYQSMVGQLLFLKTDMESWRSQNVWGTTFWMFASFIHFLFLASLVPSITCVCEWPLIAQHWPSS